MKRLSRIVLSVFLTGLLLILGCSNGTEPVSSTDGDTIGWEVGNQAPDFTYYTVAHGEISLSHYQGQVVLLYFLGNGSYDCIVAGPILESEIYQDLKDLNFETIGLDLYVNSMSCLGLYQTKTGVTFPLCMEARESGMDYNAERDHAVLIDQKGVIRYRTYEPTSHLEELKDIINDTLW